MAELQVSIVGLGYVGTSIGLALHKAKTTCRIVGHDRDGEASGQAHKLGAVDKTDWNLVSACERADLVILSTPLPGIYDTMRAIAPHLKNGCVVTDTAPVKGLVLAWARELLPAGVEFVGGHPIVASGKTGQADLFCGATYCLTPTPGTSEEALQRAEDLVGLLEATPLFLDAAEHDGLVAGVEQLPALLALALAGTNASAQCWRDVRRLAGDSFQQGTASLEGEAEALSGACLGNKDGLVRWIDALVDELQRLRGLVTEGESQALKEAFEEAQSSRALWMSERAGGRWEEIPRLKAEKRPGMMKRLIGLG